MAIVFHARPKSQPWRIIAYAATAMTVFYGVVLSLIPTNIVITRLHYDPLIYFLQAQYLAAHGTLKGLTFGVGLGPVVYAPIAAYVRAPLFLLFHNVDTLIRVIQIENVILLVGVGILCSTSSRTVLAEMADSAVSAVMRQLLAVVQQCLPSYVGPHFCTLADRIHFRRPSLQAFFIVKDRCAFDGRGVGDDFDRGDGSENNGAGVIGVCGHCVFSML